MDEHKIKHRNIVIAVSLGILILLFAVGTLIFHRLEDWTWVQSFYFTVVTVTTVGYGDLTPSTDAARLVTALFILFGVGLGAGIISFYGSAAVKSRIRQRIDDDSEEN